MGYLEMRDFATGMRRLVAVGVLLNAHIIEREPGTEIVRLDNGESFRVEEDYEYVHAQIAKIVQQRQAAQAAQSRHARTPMGSMAGPARNGGLS